MAQVNDKKPYYYKKDPRRETVVPNSTEYESYKRYETAAKGALMLCD
jgi:hypothetical protein